MLLPAVLHLLNGYAACLGQEVLTVDDCNNEPERKENVRSKPHGTQNGKVTAYHNVCISGQVWPD